MGIVKLLQRMGVRRRHIAALAHFLGIDFYLYRLMQPIPTTTV